MADIFVHVDSAQHGPYKAEQLRAWLRDGTLTPETLAWREGMADWQPLSAWDSIATAQIPRTARPYRPPGATSAPAMEVERGFNRKQYLGIWILANILVWGVILLIQLFVAGAVSSRSLKEDSVSSLFVSLGLSFIAAIIFLLVLALWLGVKRLQNIGWHGALVLLLLAPIANLFMAVCLIVLPPGFARTHKLDGAAWTWIVLIVLFIGASVATVMYTEVGERARRLYESRPQKVLSR